MRKAVCFKSMLRRPVVTLFLLLLVGTISFAFISRAAQYIIVERENGRLVSYFVASGMVGGVYDDVSRAVELLEDSQYVDYQDVRRYTSGLLIGMTNGDTSGGGVRIGGDVYPRLTLNNMVVVYATITEIKYKTETGKPDVFTGSAEFTAVVDTVVCGYPDSVLPGETVTFEYSGEDAEQMLEQVGLLEVGGRYLLNSRSRWPIHRNYRGELTLFPLWSGEDAPYFMQAAQGPVDFSGQGMESLLNAIEMADANQRLIKITSTKNMSAMPNFAAASQMYTLSRGRWLTYEDELAQNPYCVIEGGFARVRGLEVGDKITVSFTDLPASHFGYILDAPDWIRTQTMPEQYAQNAQYMPWNTWFEDWEDTYDWENWEGFRQSPVSEPVELEIVGIYFKKRGYTLIGTHDHSLVFIPDSALPQGYGEREQTPVTGGRHSFVLKSALDRAAFVEEMGDKLAQIGLTPYFVENNAESFISAMALTRQSAAFNAAVFAAVLVLSLALAVFIYMHRYMREFAILRALGETKRAAAAQTAIPLLLLGTVAISVGGYFSWDYSLYRAQRTLSFIKMPDGIWRPMGTLSTLWLVGIIAAALALFAAFTFCGAWLVARRPALELLQGGPRRKMRPAPPAPNAADSAPFKTARPLVLARPQSATGKPGPGVSARHIWRHIVRAPFKSALTALVALFFVLALGWMGGAINSNSQTVDRLYATARLEGRIKYSIGSSEEIILDKRTSGNLAASEHVGDFYVEEELAGALIEYGGQVYSPGESIRLAGATNLEIFFPDDVTNISVEYAEGFDSGIFPAQWAEDETVPVLLPKDFAQLHGLALGASARFSADQSAGFYDVIIAGLYEITGGAGGGTLPSIIAPYSALEALQRERRGIVYSAARIIANNEYSRNIFTSEWEIGRILTGNTKMYTFCTFNTADLDNAVKPLEKNLRLLSVLYPVTIALSVIIACGLAVLLTLQSAREAAVMRVLGAGRLRVRLMLSAQQTALCLAGIFAGLAPLFAAGGGGAGPLLCAALYLLGAMAGSVFSSVLVSNKMPLELLQVKE